jgi:protein required for attachment to host cells
VNKLAILHDAIIFVGDGRKALFLRNDGDEKFPNLKTKQVFTEENPSSHEQGTDKPGSTFASRPVRAAAKWARPTGITWKSTDSSSVSPVLWSGWCAAAQCRRLS